MRPGGVCPVDRRQPYQRPQLSRGALLSSIGAAAPVACLAGLQYVTIWVTLLSEAIKSFRHKGLKRFVAAGNRRGIQTKHADRLRLILGRLNAAADSRDLNLPGLDVHELQGARKGTWAVKVSGNWRVTFGFACKDAERVDYEDYH